MTGRCRCDFISYTSNDHTSGSRHTFSASLRRFEGEEGWKTVAVVADVVQRVSLRASSAKRANLLTGASGPTAPRHFGSANLRVRLTTNFGSGDDSHCEGHITSLPLHFLCYSSTEHMQRATSLLFSHHYHLEPWSKAPCVQYREQWNSITAGQLDNECVDQVASSK